MKGIKTVEYFFVVTFGLVIGSFLNVCIYRIPKEESIAYPPSHCDSCRKKLKIIDLIPIMSYLITKGRCRQCGVKIDLMYPVIEILNSLLYLMIYINMGISIINLKYYILASILIVIGVIDYKTKYVYSNTVVFSEIIGLLFIIIEFIFKGQEALNFIIGGFLGLIALKLIQFLTNGIGEGDIEIGIICGIFLGIKGVVSTIFLSILLGGIAGIVLLTFKIKKRNDSIPFVPFISIAAFLTILYGNKIVDLYLKFI